MLPMIFFPRIWTNDNIDIKSDNLPLTELDILVEEMPKSKVFDEIGNYAVNVYLFDEKLIVQHGKNFAGFHHQSRSSTLLRRMSKYCFDHFTNENREVAIMTIF